VPPEKTKNILLTGASRGLGRAMLAGFAARGHVVWGCARNPQAVDALRRQFSSPHAFEPLDVSRDDEVRAWAAKAAAEGFVPDLLVNNAAIVNRNAPLWEISAAEFDQLLAVNVSGVANVVRHFLPPMLARSSGVIVNFSSGWGRSTSPEVAPYCTTKWAVEGLSRALADELPSGMACVPLNPGIINTDMLQSCFGPSAKSYPDAGQWAQRAVPFLLSLGAEHNGQPLTVPGEE
jgi:NAD(P)-dependent dehydrogenase (short-subunit alcohol dehydrogenase family)